MPWKEEIDLARTAQALQIALEVPQGSDRVIELAKQLASQTLEHVGNDAELVGEYGEFTRALDASSKDAKVAGALLDPSRDRQLQRLRRDAGFRLPDMAGAVGVPLRRYQSYETGELPIPPRVASAIAEQLGAASAAEWFAEKVRPEVFCEIKWSRDDIATVIENGAGVPFQRGGEQTEEVEDIIDRAIEGIGNGLQDQSTEDGWDTIYALIPPDVFDMADDLAHDKGAERDDTSLEELSGAQREAANALDRDGGGGQSGRDGQER